MAAGGAFAACNGDDSTVNQPGDSGNPEDGSISDTNVPDTAEAGCVTLTVKNILSWCAISVGGGTEQTLEAQTVCVAPGSTVTLTAAPSSATFELGPRPWHDTSGDTGSGDPGHVIGSASTTTVVVGASEKCVWACCPFTNGSGCPTTDQCP